MSTITSTVAIARSALETSVRRYARSWGLWALLLLSPIAARLWIGDPNGIRAAIAVDDRAPVMTSAMLGVSLGIVVSTLLLPAAFIYFRASVTRRQPWQVTEVTGASRIALALGHLAADVTVAGGALLALTMAGFIIAVVAGLPGGLLPGQLATGLWVVALPSLTMAAALRRLLDALPWTRGAWGEVVAVALWIAALTAPAASLDNTHGQGTPVIDLAGFVQPLTATLPPGKADIMIGGGPDTHGTIALDAWAGLHGPGYLAQRALWMLLAVVVTMMAGLAYRPHAPRTVRRARRPARWLGTPRRLPALAPDVPAAGSATFPFPGLVSAEWRLIGRGRPWRSAALLIALASAVVDYRHVAGPAALLLLIFGMTAHIGRAEQRRLLALTVTTSCSPAMRRTAFVLAVVGWAIAMAAPAIVIDAMKGQVTPLLLSIATAGVGACGALLLGVLTRSASAPRLVLLIGWYVWLSV